jgi:hypothetical protein
MELVHRIQPYMRDGTRSARIFSHPIIMKAAELARTGFGVSDTFLRVYHIASGHDAFMISSLTIVSLLPTSPFCSCAYTHAQLVFPYLSQIQFTPQ